MAVPGERMTLPEGRRLGFARFGDRAGFPVLYCHGFPASRLEGQMLDAAARSVGVALIAADRPGMGLSEFQPGRCIMDWPVDVGHLADALGLDHFAVIGGSGGAPYAAACALRLGGRLVRVATVAGMGPAHEPGLSRTMSLTARLGFTLARRTPRLFALGYGVLGRLVARHPSLVFKLNEATAPDQAVLAQPELHSILLESTREAFRQGPSGAIRELELLAHPWGFDASQITVPLDVWHGDRDGVVPPAMAEWYASQVPHTRLTILPEEGHLSLPVRHGQRILEALIEP